jgi:hypothetical protein
VSGRAGPGTGRQERLTDTYLQGPLDCGLPTDPQVYMGTRKTRTTPVRTARIEPPLRPRSFVSALSIQPVKAGYPRPVVRLRG